MSSSVVLAQISDTHLLPDQSALLRGCNPWQSMQAVLQQAIQVRPDGLLLTGDLADSGERAAYEHLQGAIAPFGLPVYCLPGNHDNLDVMQDVLRSQGTPQAIDLGHWQLLLLSSVLLSAQFGEGYLTTETLQWLQAELRREPHKPTAIALHHHPVPVNIDWVDQMQVQNAGDLLMILDIHPQVRLVTFGHIHLDFYHQRQRSHHQPPISFYGCPSTHLQLTASASSAKNAHLPGFRLLQLYSDGTYQTQVQRTARISMGEQP